MENNGQLLTRATFTSAMKYYFWMMDWFYFQFKKEDGKNNWLPTTVLFFNLSKYDNECLDKCSCFIFFIRLWSIHNCYLSFLQWGFYFCKVFFPGIYMCICICLILSILSILFCSQTKNPIINKKYPCYNYLPILVISLTDFVSLIIHLD